MISSQLYQPLVYFYLVAPCFTSISQQLVRLKGGGKQYVVFPPTRQNFLCLVRFQGEILISPQTGYIPDVKHVKKREKLCFIVQLLSVSKCKSHRKTEVR